MDTPPPLTKFEDRKNGLVVFGVFTMLMGGVCALFVPLIFIAQAAAANSGIPQNGQSMMPAIFIFGALAVMLIWLGMGSVLAKRWARALLLIFSWSLLIIGVLSICMMGVMMPRIMQTITSANQSAQPGQPELSSTMGTAVVVSTMIISGIIYVVIPGIWVLFYRSKNVKATCEANDPTIRWTDRCPLPVLAISIWLALGVPTMLMMIVACRGVAPFFGSFAVGASGAIVYMILAAVWGYSSWAIYKLDLRGWWVIVAGLIMFSISSAMTYSRHDLSELYALMGYTEQQIQQMQPFINSFKGNAMAWGSLIGTAPVLCYLIYIRKFFTTAPGNGQTQHEDR